MKVTLDGRSDQYGLAVTVFQVLTNWRYPIDDTTIGPIFMAKLGLAPMRHPVEHDPRIPQAVSDAVMRALATDRERRFSSSVEFAETVLVGFGLGERRAIGPHSSAVKPTPVAFEPAPAPVQPAAPPEPSFEVRENSLGMRLVRIPAGLFTMGANDGDADEKPVRVVRITKQFLLGQTEVSQQQFTTIMGATPWRGSWFNSPIDCRSAFRGNATPMNRYFIVGFRVVCELE